MRRRCSAPDGAWEILQFANAVLTGERTYELSRLLRGELGSEAAIGDPLPAGAPFVVLDPHRDADRARRRNDRAAHAAARGRGEPRSWRSVVRSRSTLRPRPLAFQPLQSGASAARREAGGVRFSWRPRKRGLAGVTFAAWPDLGEAREAYELEILSGATVLRTLSATITLDALCRERRDARLRQHAIELQRAPLSDIGRGRPRPACHRHSHPLEVP